jgi:hypothetical protein
MRESLILPVSRGVKSDLIDQESAKNTVGTALGIALGAIMLLVFAGLTIADDISSDLSTGATTVAGFIGLAVIIGIAKLR